MALRAAAKTRGLTLRALVLSALRDAGVLKGFSEADLADRRATLAVAKARLWREHIAAQSDMLPLPAGSPLEARKLKGSTQ